MAAYDPEPSPSKSDYLFTQRPRLKPGGEMLLATLSWGLTIDRKTWPLYSGNARIGGGIASGVGIVWWWMVGGCRVLRGEGKGQGLVVVRVVVREVLGSARGQLITLC